MRKRAVHLTRHGLTVGILLLAAVAGDQQTAPALGAQTPLAIETFTIRSFDGRERAAEKITLGVPVGDAQSDRRLNLVFWRLRSQAAATRPPVVFLMGGPGVPATVMAPIPPYFTLFTRLAESSDVLLLDQRGLGESNPPSDCPPAPSVSTSLFESKPQLLATFGAVYAACARALEPGVRPSDFTIEHVADDVEHARRAIGADKVDLLGFSFGSRIALEVMRRHPRSVRRVVLQGALGVETVRTPALEERNFRLSSAALDKNAAGRGLPSSMEASLRTLQTRLTEGPIRLSIRSNAGGMIDVQMSREVFNSTIAGRVGDPNLPAVLATAVDGDYRLLARYAETIYQDLEKGAGSLMARALMCSTASPAAALREASRAGGSALLGEPFDNLMMGEELCTRLGVSANRATQAPVRSDLPTMLINGTLDARTPPDRAEPTARALSNSTHVIVTNGGHELLPMAEVQELVSAFFDGRPVPQSLTVAVPVARSIEEARQPPQRR